MSFPLFTGMILRAGYQAKQANLELSDTEAAKREIKRLQRRLAEVEEEREILKKTINIFSRKSE